MRIIFPRQELQHLDILFVKTIARDASWTWPGLLGLENVFKAFCEVLELSNPWQRIPFSGYTLPLCVEEGY